MKISFDCRTNKDYVAINTCVFTLPNGTTLTVDRDETEYDIVDGKLKMVWNNVYLWAINDCNIFTHMCDAGFYIEKEECIEEFKKLVENAKISFELESDADEDYTVDDIDITSIS